MKLKLIFEFDNANTKKNLGGYTHEISIDDQTVINALSSPISKCKSINAVFQSDIAAISERLDSIEDEFQNLVDELNYDYIELEKRLRHIEIKAETDLRKKVDLMLEENDFLQNHEKSEVVLKKLKEFRTEILKMQKDLNR